MLRLGDQICRDERGISGFICDYNDLAGSEESIESDAPRERPLGELDVRVPRSDDLIDGRDRLGAKRHRRDRSRSTGAKDVIELQLMTRRQDQIAAAKSAGRRTDHNCLYARDLRGNRQHD
jgi:hypothetical protein